MTEDERKLLEATADAVLELYRRRPSQPESEFLDRTGKELADALNKVRGI